MTKTIPLKGIYCKEMYISVYRALFIINKISNNPMSFNETMNKQAVAHLII